jgi:hypothetical protein
MPRTPAASTKPDASSETAADADTPQSARELRRRHREAIRAKVTGKVVIADVPPANRKIVFDDDNSDNAISSEITKQKTDPQDTNATKESHKELLEGKTTDDDLQAADEEEDDVSDDDAVEEVQTSVARQVEQEVRSQEHQSARTALQGGKKKRKRQGKSTTQQNEETEEEFDEEFFQQLAKEKHKVREERKRAKKLARESKGRHTNFVVQEETTEMALPTDADGVQVAVLSDDVHAVLSEPTPESYVYSRAHLESGRDGLSAKQIQKAKRRKQFPVESPSWQRSTKMNRLLTAGRGRRTGMPALHFAKNQK